MIRFFNVKHPYVTIFLLLYALLLNLPLFIDPGFFSVPEPQAPFAQLFFYITKNLFGNNHYVLSALAIMLLFIQSLMLNNLVNSTKLFEAGTFVPSLIYLTAACLFREFLFLSPVMLSITFIIPALGMTLRFFRTQRCNAEAFDMGFLIAVAALFYRPAFVLILLLVVALAVMRPFNWREAVIGLSGFLCVFFLAGTFYFMIDRLPAFLGEYLFAPTIVPRNHFATPLAFSIIIGYTAALAGFATLIFLFNFLKSAVLTRKFLILSGWTFVLMILTSLFTSNLSLHYFLILSVPLSIVISYLFVNIKRVRIANFIHYLWVSVVLFFQYFRNN